MTAPIPADDPLVKLQTAQASTLMSTSLGLARRGRTGNSVALSMAIQALIQVASANGMKGSEIYRGLGHALAFAVSALPPYVRSLVLADMGHQAIEEAAAGDGTRAANDA